MPKRKVTTCDLCGSDDMGDYIVLRAKKQWTCWYESGFRRIHIYICENCQKKIKEAAEYSRKEDETNAARN